MDGDDKVGYGRLPKATQFRKGKSKAATDL
jgi:hypothetical protein